MQIMLKIMPQLLGVRGKRALSTLMVSLTLVVICDALAGAVDLGLIDSVSLKSGSAKWVILDARPKSDWEAGHIPGAIQFSWDNYTRTDAKGVKYSSFPPQEAEKAVAPKARYQVDLKPQYLVATEDI